VDKQAKCLFVLRFPFYQHFGLKKLLENSGGICKKILPIFLSAKTQNQPAFFKKHLCKPLN